jgi:hypothetical protein
MSVSIISSTRLARPSAVIASQMTDKERMAFGTREIDFCFDAAEQAPEYSGLVLRDRARGLPITVTGGTMSSLNGRAAIDWGADASGKAQAAYQVPSSYFIACLVDLDTTATSNSLVASSDTTGQRLFFGILNNGHPYLSHGPNAGDSIDWTSPPVVTGKHIIWATYDAVSGAAEMGVDSVTAGVTGTINIAHKGHPTTDFFGGAGVAEIDGRGAINLVVPRYLGGIARAATREAILAWPAEAGSVALAA